MADSGGMWPQDSRIFCASAARVSARLDYRIAFFAAFR